MDIIEKYLHNISYKFPKGYPDLENKKDIALLETLINKLGVPVILENIGIVNILKSSPELKEHGNFEVTGRTTLVLTFEDIPSRGATSNSMREEVFNSIKNLVNSNPKLSNYERGVGGSSSIGFATAEYEGTTYKFVIKGTSSSSQGDTDVKEALVSLFYISRIDTPFNKENYEGRIPELVRIAESGIEGENPNVSKKVISFLNSISGDSRAPNINFLNQSLSPAVLMKKDYPKGRVIRTGVFDKIRSKAQTLTGYPADKWNPGDLYLYLGGDLNIEGKDNIELINNLFVDEWGDKDKPLVSISLKQEKAQGGKAKALLAKYTDVRTDYNLTREEINYNEEEFKTGIGNLRKKLNSLISSNPNITYNIDSGNLPDRLNFLRGKFAALKSIEFLFRQFNPGEVDEALVALAGFGMSLTGVNPTFFKLIGLRSGENAELTTFKKGQNVILNNVDGKYDPIEIKDESTFGGLKLEFNILKGGKPFSVVINARNNGNTQGTLEIQSIKPL